MIYRLDTTQKDYIAELGDGFENAENADEAQGLKVADYYAEASGAGVYYISYRVKVKKDLKNLFIFAGRKQLVRYGSRKAGEVIEGTLYLHICEIYPRYGTEAKTIDKLGFALACEDLSGIEEAAMAAEKLSDDTKIPVVYLAGDSTVTDQMCAKPFVPGGCYTSWGQSLAYFIGGSAAVDNQAQSGLTTQTFRETGRFGIVMKYIRPGDLCLFQFGHNDQKLAELQATTGYRENLLRYIEEIRSRCGIPVLVTPLARNLWKDDGTYNELLQEYADEVKRIGEETGAPVIDLHSYSSELFKKNGRDASRIYFHPGDATHTNEFGAWLFAQFIARSLSALDPEGFAIDRADSADLEPDEQAGELTAATVKHAATAEQKEVFDAIERAGDNLVAVIEKAKSEAQKL